MLRALSCYGSSCFGDQGKTLSANLNDIEIFVEFFNIQLNATSFVAERIRESADGPEVVKLQDALFQIQSGIKQAAHHSILSVLKLSVKLLDEHAASEKKKDVRTDIQKQLAALKAWANELVNIRTKCSVPLAALKGEQVDAFRKVHQQSIEWKRQNRDKSLPEFEGFEKFSASFKKIPFDERMSVRTTYTRRCITELAEFFSLQGAYFEVLVRAEWPKE